LWVTTGVVTVPQSITVLLVQQQAQQQVQQVPLLQRVQQAQQQQAQQQQVLQQAQRLVLFCHKLSKRTQPTRQLRELIFS
jgi:hypothetical protein